MEPVVRPSSQGLVPLERLGQLQGAESAVAPCGVGKCRPVGIFKVGGGEGAPDSPSAG